MILDEFLVFVDVFFFASSLCSCFFFFLFVIVFDIYGECVQEAEE